MRNHARGPSLCVEVMRPGSLRATSELARVQSCLKRGHGSGASPCAERRVQGSLKSFRASEGMRRQVQGKRLAMVLQASSSVLQQRVVGRCRGCWFLVQGSRIRPPSRNHKTQALNSSPPKLRPHPPQSLASSLPAQGQSRSEDPACLPGEVAGGEEVRLLARGPSFGRDFWRLCPASLISY